MPLLGKRTESNENIFYQTLKGHTEDALWYLRREFDDLRWYKRFCDHWDIPLQDFVKACFVSVALHDIGKSTKQFQSNIRHGRRSSRYPHAFFAVAVVHKLASDTGYRPLIEEWTNCDLPYPLLETLVILAHHSQLYRDIYHTVDRKVDWEPEVVEFGDYITEWHHRLDFKKFFDLNFRLAIDLDYVRCFDANKILQFIRDICFDDVFAIRRRGNNEILRLKAVYTEVLALLKRCDIHASIGFDTYAHKPNIKTNVTDALDDHLKLPVAKWLTLNDLLGAGMMPFDFQRKVEASGQFTMLLAPCGRGKTEAAVAWATNLAREGKIKRIILAMPTQVTSTAMWKRLGKHFGRDHVGLYHGRSFAELKEYFSDKDDTVDVDDVRKEQFQGETLWKSVTITTVDHLLYAFVHGYPQADFSLGHLQQSAIIFDEVHYYDKVMLGHLKQLFSILRAWNVPHLLMSGTFPSFLRKEVDPSENLYIWHEDKQGLRYSPFTIVKENSPMFISNSEAKELNVQPRILDLIEEAYRKGKKTAVIVNTIQRAKAMYRFIKQQARIEGQDLYLLHSQFTFADRRRKESETLKRLKENGPFVLVSTQIVEVSLDFSCDLMMTEVAPADALGQRAGRLHRGRNMFSEEDWSFRLLVFPVGDQVAPYVEAKTVLNRTWEKLSEGPTSYSMIRRLCESAYKGWEVRSSNLLKLFEENTLFGNQPREIRFSEDEGRIFKTRQDSDYTMDVIPETIYDHYTDAAFDAEHLVAVPYWWYHRSVKEELGWFSFVRDRKGQNWILCKLPYDSEVGFDERLLAQAVGLGGVFLEPSSTPTS
jgi:CRISPR-associated endonuclease/helicase Cas3